MYIRDLYSGCHDNQICTTYNDITFPQLFLIFLRGSRGGICIWKIIHLPLKHSSFFVFHIDKLLSYLNIREDVFAFNVTPALSI